MVVRVHGPREPTLGLVFRAKFSNEPFAFSEHPHRENVLRRCYYIGHEYWPTRPNAGINAHGYAKLIRSSILIYSARL